MGLCLATALGISATLGASLGQTAVRLAASGVICGFDALFAVAAATLSQRSASWRAAAVAGVLANVVSAAVLVVAVWGGGVGETEGRISLVAGSVGSALGVSGFLLSQQRSEDPRAITGLMMATLALDWALTIAVSIDVIFAPSSTAATAGVHVPFGGVGFTQFLAVTGLLTLLGLRLLPLMRRAHPAYRGGQPAR